MGVVMIIAVTMIAIMVMVAAITVAAVKMARTDVVVRPPETAVET